jgi:hypothetical protein
MPSVVAYSKTIPQACVTLLFISAIGAAQTGIPAAGLCNTGLTAASPLAAGCTTGSPVTPVNPESGGPSVDGNWELAIPYPSVPYNRPAPNPCSLTAFVPAWVDAPWLSWLNPDDGISQWISPEVEGPVAPGGWYVYRTTVPTPPASLGHSAYQLTVSGQFLVDNDVAFIYMEDPAQSHSICGLVARPGSPTQDWAWNPFNFTATVLADTHAYLYFVVYNGQQSYGNPTGLRIEFTTAYFNPK